jgi:transposase InsO family protein
MFDEDDPRTRWALFRYQVVSAYLVADPPRGYRAALRESLTNKVWMGPDGYPVALRPETLRVWVRRYRQDGFAGLYDKQRPRRGVRVLDEAQAELLCKMKREVAERSLDQLIRIAEDTVLFPKGVLRRSTVHRVLREAGLSKRPTAESNTKDVRRFEADRPNDLWQSDMLEGPYLPDPEQPGKTRRAHLYAFIDDHSRLLLHGRFSFKGSLPHLELVFRRAIQKYGVPRRVYYDNGQVYRSHHMAQIVAHLGIHRVVFTTVRRPEGHGKIEALNRYIRNAFLAELKASNITTLDGLNEAFVAWMQREYNTRVHSETQQAPRERYLRDSTHIRYADEEALRQAFLWKETRVADKAGVFSLLGTKYQVRTLLDKRKIEVRFDPEAMEEVEVWQDDAFVERTKPFEVGPHRGPKRTPPAHATDTPKAPSEPAVDWLSHIVEAHRKEGFVEPKPRAHAEQALAERRARDRAVIELLTERLDDGVVDVEVIQAWLDRFGPLDPEHVGASLDDLLRRDRADHHVHHYLEAIRRRLDEAQHDEDDAT